MSKQEQTSTVTVLCHKNVNLFKKVRLDLLTICLWISNLKEIRKRIIYLYQFTFTELCSR
jgi:hypothetical protein